MQPYGTSTNSLVKWNLNLDIHIINIMYCISGH